MDFNEVKEIAKDYFAKSSELRNACYDFINEKVRQKGSVDFEDLEDGCFAVYDGGNHPEYASGWQRVSSLNYCQRNDGKDGFVEVEFESGYEPIENLSTDDLHEVALCLNAALSSEA